MANEDTPNPDTDVDAVADQLDAEAAAAMDPTDTLEADAAADTVAADAGEDTVVADGADTVVAAAGADPVQADPDPEPEPVARRGVVVEALAPDDIEKGIDEAIAAVAADELLSEGQKKAERSRLLVEKALYRDSREDKAERAAERKQKQEDANWAASAKEHGLPREKLESLWQDAWKEQATKHPNADQNWLMGRAAVAYENKIEAAKAAAPKPKTTVTTAPKLPKVKTTAQGAVLSPPGGASGGRATKAALTPEEKFDSGNWTLPN
jgi:hypothetical protein